MRDIALSAAAETDLRSIWRFSLENWGEAQADLYLDELDKGMRRCGEDPDSGKRRDFIREGYRSALIRKHVVFYTFDEDRVLIQRVLHGSMDPGRHLPDAGDG